jgi:hypothetical protein
MEKPSQRLRDLPLLVPFISGWKKPGIEQHGSSQIDKLCLGVERMVVRVVERSSNRRHDSPLCHPPGDPDDRRDSATASS